MDDTFGSSVVFRSRIRSKCIGHNIFTGIRGNFRKKQTPIYVPVNKTELHFSHSSRHFSLLPQAVSKRLINCLSQKFNYDYMVVDTVINGFIHNEVRSCFHIFDH